MLLFTFLTKYSTRNKKRERNQIDAEFVAQQLVIEIIFYLSGNTKKKIVEKYNISNRIPSEDVNFAK